MRTIRVDYLQDPECRGHHLDREMTDTCQEKDKFPKHSRDLISALQRIDFCAPDGLEMVAVVAVGVVQEDGTWHFGDPIGSIEMKAGMLYISDNHFTVWLSDEERRAKYLVTSFFLREATAFCSGHPEELRDFMRIRIIEGIERLIQKDQKDIGELLEELHEKHTSLNTLIQGRTRL